MVQFVVQFLLFILLMTFSDSGCYKKSYSATYEYLQKNTENFITEGNRWLCLMIGLCSSFDGGHFQQQRSVFGPVYMWSQLEFAYPSAAEREADVQSGAFIPGKPAPIDVDVYYGHEKKRIFVTIPRFQPGVPVALGTIVDSNDNTNVPIKPYPNWDWHRHPDKCKHNRIVSVYRVKIDECGRLWVLDTGRLEEEQTCPPQILAFDLKTDQLLHRYEIPTSQLESRSILVTPVIDIRDAQSQCRDTFVYVADCQTYSIIVYDVRRNRSWRVTDKTMYPYPNYGTFRILQDSFDLMDGILGMAIEPYREGYDRKLYYHAMSSPTENWVYTSHLRNETRFKHDPSSSPEIFHTYSQGRDTQCAAEAMDRDGIMYFGLMSHVTLNCWNTNTDYGPKTIDTIANNQETLQFASGVKVISNVKGVQELWVMTSRFQKIGAGTLDPHEINFRISAGKIDDLIFSSKCRNRQQGHGNGHGHGHRNGGAYGLVKPNNYVQPASSGSY